MLQAPCVRPCGCGCGAKGSAPSSGWRNWTARPCDATWPPPRNLGPGCATAGRASRADEFIGSVMEQASPSRRRPRQGWRLLVANHDQVKIWLDAGITAVKVQRLLARRGVVVPRRTVHRYASEVCEAGRTPRSTVRVADGKPRDECQVDFGRLGLIHDSLTGRRRVCQALVFTAASPGTASCG